MTILQSSYLYLTLQLRRFIWDLLERAGVKGDQVYTKVFEDCGNLAALSSVPVGWLWLWRMLLLAEVIEFP